MVENSQLIVRGVARREFSRGEKSLQHLFALFAPLTCHFAQGCCDASTRLSGRDVVDPIGLNGLLSRRKYLYLIAVRQAMAHRYEAVIDLRAHAVTSHHGMDGKGEVEHRRSLRKRDDFALRCEDVQF